jgi:hypothetical protein
MSGLLPPAGLGPPTAHADGSALNAPKAPLGGPRPQWAEDL